MPQYLGMTEIFLQIATALIEALRAQPGPSRVQIEEYRGQEVWSALREFCKLNPPNFSS